jgi:hypothetical protein
MDRLLYRGDSILRQSLRPRQLIQVRLRYDQLCRPLDLLLVLHIQLSHANCLRGVEFVFGEELRRRELEDIQPARNF